METIKNTWGGSRGGGRPRNDRNITLSVRITQEAMDQLNSITTNKSEFIDNLIKSAYMEATKFSNLSLDDQEKLLQLEPSTWKEDSPYWHHDYNRTASKTKLAEALLAAVFSGECDSYAPEFIDSILNTLHDHDDCMALSEKLITNDNYVDFQPDYSTIEMSDEFKAAKEKYDGIDAWVEAARIEFAYNLKEGYADESDLIGLFK